jgi:hypothetical protein
MGAAINHPVRKAIEKRPFEKRIHSSVGSVDDEEIQLRYLMVGRDPVLEEVVKEETIPTGEGAGDG